MNEHFKVGDTVRLTKSYAQTNPNSKYLNVVGTVSSIQKACERILSYRVIFPAVHDYDWFRLSELELVPPESNYCLRSIRYMVLELMEGKVFYTENGTKVHKDKGVLKFGEAPLNLEKLTDVKLSTTDNSKPPFRIDNLKGTHCQVWNTQGDKDTGIYRLITEFVHSTEYKFKTIEGIGWKYAEPVK